MLFKLHKSSPCLRRWKLCIKTISPTWLRLRCLSSCEHRQVHIPRGYSKGQSCTACVRFFALIHHTLILLNSESYFDYFDNLI
jgi:hypothetical protein